MNRGLRDRLAGWFLDACVRPRAAAALDALEKFSSGADPNGEARGLSGDEIEILAADGDLFERTPAGGLRIRPELLPELERVRDRARRFRAALEAVRRRAGQPPPGTDPLARRGEGPSAGEIAWLLAAATVLFEERLFFEVHELLEPAWARARGASRRILQGIVQVAVALYHHERGNLRGAARLLEEGCTKLRSGELLEGLSLDGFRQDAEAAGCAVREQIAAGRWEPIPAPRLRP